MVCAIFLFRFSRIETYCNRQIGVDLFSPFPFILSLSLSMLFFCIHSFWFNSLSVVFRLDLFYINIEFRSVLINLCTPVSRTLFFEHELLMCVRILHFFLFLKYIEYMYVCVCINLSHIFHHKYFYT